MSSYVDATWFYQLKGRKICLYLYKDYPTDYPDQLGRITSTYSGKTVEYPDEDITNGLRIEYTGFDETFVKEAIEDTSAIASGTGISFDPGPAATISDSNDGFADTGKAFAQGDKIRVIGSASNDDDYTLTPSGTVDEDTLTITGTFTTEAAGESVSVYQIPKEDSSPSETSHVNLNRMLCLAVVDYVKAQVAEISGSVELKEYYIKEFWKKIGDDQSNKLKHSISFASSVYSVV